MVIQYVTKIPGLSLIIYCDAVEISKKKSIMSSLEYLRKNLLEQMLKMPIVFFKI